MNDTYEKQMYWKNVRSKKVREAALFLDQNFQDIYDTYSDPSWKKKVESYF